MRHLQLMRTRTNQLSVSLELFQSPLILYNQCDDDDLSTAGPSHLSLAILISSTTAKHIGGLTLSRKVLLRRRIPKTKNWGSWDEIQTQEVQVLGETFVHGKQRLEVTLTLPPRLPETRETHYDQIIHTLTAVIQDVAPNYLTSAAALRIERARALSAQAGVAASLSTMRSPSTPLSPVVEDHEMPIWEERLGKTAESLASCKKVFEVVHCPSPQGDVPALECEQVIRLSDSGKVRVKTASDLFVLGSLMDVTFDFQDLTPDTTIHGISAGLVQETGVPVKTELPDLDSLNRPRPAMYRNPSAESATSTTSENGPRWRRRPVFSRLSTMWASFKEKPPTPQSSILDDYTLLNEGLEQYTPHGGLNSINNTYLWRGEAARAIDMRSGQSGEVEGGYLDDSKAGETHILHPGEEVAERFHSRLLIHRRVRLPSEVNGAHASSSTLAPYLARVVHRISVDIVYSVLGQDHLGNPLPVGSGAEGSPRQAKAVIEVALAPCTITPSSVQPPSYFSPSTSLAPLRRRMSAISAETSGSGGSVRSFELARTELRLPSADVPHARAFCASNGLVVASKKVFYSEADVIHAVERHRKEKNACACTLQW